MERTDVSPGSCPVKHSDCPLIEEVRRLREECRRWEDLSQTDALTGLFNLRYLLKTLEGEMERTRRTGLPTALIMADIDHFKGINDTYGHESGNQTLKSFSDILRKTIRRIDIPCRYGGEEFAIILPSTHLSDALLTAQRLRATLSETDLEIEGAKVRLTASFGVEAYEGGASLSVESFIAAADKFLLDAKKDGRNRVCAGKPRKRLADEGLTEKERAALSRRRS